ncbi:MAG: chemotaxis response regulator protein-glutamate methylesterase [Verrucomicrobiota bacterium JB022]|nr:chemotaxis response regulator protein-glutamate methylesterase [Verrucomicrobiota bacterium JB022]
MADLSSPIRVLLCDDSAVIRSSVAQMLRRDPELEVVGTAENPYQARDQILKLDPEVLLLDLEMPRMDGLSFLSIIMRERPMPVVIFSSLSQQGSHVAWEAMQRGAIEVLGKPRSPRELQDLAPILIYKLKAAALAGRSASFRKHVDAAIEAGKAPSPVAAIKNSQPATAFSQKPQTKEQVDCSHLDPKALILLGASTGGTEALKNVLVDLPADMPPILIVQHIPAYFSASFANRLDSLCKLRVKEARHGDVCQPGHVLVAPGNYHMTVHAAAGGYRVKLDDGPRVWHQRPAVDLLMKSGAQTAGMHAIAGVLTGMGRDGAEGLLALRRRGAITFAQDEATSVVYGMPRAAKEVGAAQRVLPLHQMAAFLQEATRTRRRTSPPTEHEVSSV